jgi:hypothetical protein
MSDQSLKIVAFALAEATPMHLGIPTTPPQRWRQEGDQLVVILPDGRKIHGPMPIDKPKPLPSPIQSRQDWPAPAQMEKKKPLPIYPAISSAPKSKKVARKKP